MIPLTLNHLQHLFVEVPRFRDGQHVATGNRPATDSEKAFAISVRDQLVKLDVQKKEIERQMEEVAATCTHVVCYDTAGWPYDNRHCAGCDQYKGTI